MYIRNLKKVGTWIKSVIFCATLQKIFLSTRYFIFDHLGPTVWALFSITI